MKNNSNANINIKFGEILTIVFIVLKLCGKITWSWIWVLSPIWIPTIISIICVVIIVKVKALLEKE